MNHQRRLLLSLFITSTWVRDLPSGTFFKKLLRRRRLVIHQLSNKFTDVFHDVAPRVTPISARGQRSNMGWKFVPNLNLGKDEFHLFEEWKEKKTLVMHILLSSQFIIAQFKHQWPSKLVRKPSARLGVLHWLMNLLFDCFRFSFNF